MKLAVLLFCLVVLSAGGCSWIPRAGPSTSAVLDQGQKGGEILFDVVQDPMERANLKERHKDVYDRLVAQWNEWNATMLALDPESHTNGFTGAELADHFGVKTTPRAETVGPGTRSGG